MWPSGACTGWQRGCLWAPRHLYRGVQWVVRVTPGATVACAGRHSGASLFPGRGRNGRYLGAYSQEGRELEAAQREGESVHDDEPANETDAEKEDLRQAKVQKRRAVAAAATGLPAHDIGGVVVPAQESDSEAAKRVAEAYAAKRRLWQELRDKAVGPDLAPLRWTLDRKLRQLTKSYCSNQRVPQEGEDIVRRFLAAEAAVEAEKRDKAREAARKQKRELAKMKLVKAKIRNEAEARKLAKAKEKDKQLAAEEAACNRGGGGGGGLVFHVEPYCSHFGSKPKESDPPLPRPRRWRASRQRLARG